MAKGRIPDSDIQAIRERAPLEEIVGEFTTDLAASSKDIHPKGDGSYIIDGTATIREINRALKWELPSDGPKTLSGLITEKLESIPQNNVGLQIDDYYMETLKLQDNIIRSILVWRKSQKRSLKPRKN